MLLRRLLHSSRPLPARPRSRSSGHQNLVVRAFLPPSHFAASRTSSPLASSRRGSLSTSGRDDDDGNKPWSFAADSGDPDPFAHEDAAADAGEALPVGPAAVADEPWAKGFGVEDGENGDVFEGIYKEAASVAPASGQAAPAGDEEQWTLSGTRRIPLPIAVLGEGSMGSRVRVVGLDELGAGEDAEAELKRQQNKEREEELMKILKGPNRAFGDLIASSNIHRGND
ncbi:hypothetical protein HU200_050729 [Digitaria exilis]|uniref:Uncharacterized protein n=1 Tax=Digitaria exilis TaxID=1010633 RepID=A0A835EA38_9POAL|nr:hypothetical protein HU200_050729 [Digitaria exilis]